jgi:hypothetical protein
MEDMVIIFQEGKAYVCLRRLYPGERNVGYNMVEYLKAVDVNDPICGIMLTKKVRISKVEALMILSISVVNLKKESKRSNMEVVFMLRSGLGDKSGVIDQVQKAIEKTTSLKEKKMTDEMKSIGRLYKPFEQVKIS